MNELNELLEQAIPDIKLVPRRFYIIAAVFAVLAVVFLIPTIFVGWSIVAPVAMLSGAVSYLIAGLIVKTSIESDE